MRHELRHAEIARAAKDLGVVRPVYIAFNGQYLSSGRYIGLRSGYGRYEFDEPTHVITLGSGLHERSLREARRTVMHELTHAAQRDRYGSDEEWRAAVRQAYGTSSVGAAQARRNPRAYHRSPFEIEARENEEYEVLYEVLR